MFKVTVRDSLLHLEFHIPESSNAFSLEAARSLSRVVKEFRSWKRPVIVTSGHRSLFCSGGNLSDYARLKGKAPGLKINREITKHLDAFGAWPCVKLALIEGDALGGGVEWLARFDFRWATPSVLLAFWQRRIGLSSGWGGGKAWARKIGEENVRLLLQEGALLHPARAMRLGLVDRVLPAWKIRAEAESWASALGDSASINALSRWSSGRESAVFTSLWMGQEHKAVLEKWSKKKR
jgi:enoyl-CoA hydratase/carnithine racemase